MTHRLLDSQQQYTLQSSSKRERLDNKALAASSKIHAGIDDEEATEVYLVQNVYQEGPRASKVEEARHRDVVFKAYSDIYILKDRYIFQNSISWAMEEANPDSTNNEWTSFASREQPNSTSYCGLHIISRSS